MLLLFFLSVSKRFREEELFSVIPVIATFENLWKCVVWCQFPVLTCPPHVIVSGHRVKIEDPQKMQFSDRLSEIERYQRTMRIGSVNNNPRPIHQTHLSGPPGEDPLIYATTNNQHCPQHHYTMKLKDINNPYFKPVTHQHETLNRAKGS